VSGDGTARRWDLRAALPGDPYVLVRNCMADLTASASSADGRWAASGSEAGEVQLFDLTAAVPSLARQELTPAGGGKRAIDDLFFSATAEWLVAVDDSGGLQRWNLRSSRPAESLRRFDDHLVDRAIQRVVIAFTPDGRGMASADLQGRAWLWDLAAPGGATVKRPLSPPGDPVDEVAISPDGQWLAGVGYDVVWMWDLRDPSGPGEPRPWPKHDAPVHSVTFSRDSRFLVTTDNAAHVKIWGLPAVSTAPRSVFDAADHTSVDVALSEDGRWLATSGTTAPHLRLVRMDPPPLGEARYVVPAGGTEANGTLAFSPDGRWIATSALTLIQVWSTSHLDRAPRTLQAASFVTALQFGPDSATLAVATDRGTVSTVEVTEDAALVAVSATRQLGSIPFLAIGGTWILSRSYEQIRVLPLRLADLLAELASRVGRNLSPAEAGAYLGRIPDPATLEWLRRRPAWP
jgi:hypothetical protein